MKFIKLLPILAALATNGIAALSIDETPIITDAQIAQIIIQGNVSEVKTATQSKAISQNADVLAFSDRMIVDHTQMKGEAEGLFLMLSLVPEESDRSREMWKVSEERDATLSKVRGREFDVAYMDAQIAIHEECLDHIQSLFLPAVQSTDLRKYLVTAAAAVQRHLDDAKAVRAKVN